MKIKSPLRFFIFILTLVIVIWMCYNFVIALQTGQRFSLFGNSRDGEAVKNFVVAGVDEDGYRTDLILFCQFQPAEKKVNILQVPRDTRVENNRNDKKINSAYYSGIDVMENELYQVTGLKAENSVIVSFDAFKALVDAVGGVEIDVPIRMEYSDPAQDLYIDLQPGVQVLDGEHAEMYMRFRKDNNGGGYPDGDVGRLNAHQEFYTAVADKLLSPASIFRAPKIYKAVKENVETDFTNSEIIGLMWKMIGMNTEDVQIFSLPGEGKYIGGVSYFVADTEAAQELVSANFDTTLPTSSVKASSKNRDITVRVIDASGNDKAAAAAQMLEAAGFQVVEQLAWAEKREKSSLIEYTQKGGGEQVQTVFPDIPVVQSEKSDPDTDVTLIIGKDFQL